LTGTGVQRRRDILGSVFFPCFSCHLTNNLTYNILERDIFFLGSPFFMLNKSMCANCFVKYFIWCWHTSVPRTRACSTRIRQTCTHKDLGGRERDPFRFVRLVQG
jgi:hypothetical protein